MWRNILIQNITLTSDLFNWSYKLYDVYTCRLAVHGTYCLYWLLFLASSSCLTYSTYTCTVYSYQTSLLFVWSMKHLLPCFLTVSLKPQLHCYKYLQTLLSFLLWLIGQCFNWLSITLLCHIKPLVVIFNIKKLMQTWKDFNSFEFK